MVHYEFLFDLINRGRTVARIVGSFPHVYRLVANGQELPAIPDYGPLYRDDDGLRVTFIRGIPPAVGQSVRSPRQEHILLLADATI